MVEFRQTMDQHARDVIRRNNIGIIATIGSIQWHGERTKRFVMYTDIGDSLTLSEMKQIVTELEKAK